MIDRFIINECMGGNGAEKYIMGMPDFFKIGGLIKLFGKHGILAF